MSSSKVTPAVIIGVTVTLLTITILGYYVLTNKKTTKPDDKPAPKKAASAAEKVEKIASLETKDAAAPAVTVADVEESDDEEDEEDKEEEEAASEGKTAEELEALKTKYVDINRLADKFIKGQSYLKAAEKLSDAIDLASELPFASKDILTLYNNRSAMYEKLGEFEKSLRDITVVLTMDNLHMKARLRSARVYDALKQEQKALDDYIFHMFLERIKGDQSSQDKRIESLCQSLGMKKATNVLAEIRSSTSKSLPGTTYCRNFLENFPSLHYWKTKYGTSDEAKCKAKRAELVAIVESTSASSSPSSSSSSTAKLTATLDLVCMDLAAEEHASAFGVLSRLTDVTWTSATEGPQEPYALLYELRGTESHLKCNLDLAIAAYEQVLIIDPSSIDTKLKLASVFLDLGERAKAEKIYTELSPSPASDDIAGNITLSWVFVHSSSLWLTRDEGFKYPPKAVENAMVAVNAALDLTVSAITVDQVLEVSRKAARFVALMKSVHILTQVKAQLGENPTEEESQRNQDSVAEAKKLFPHKLAVLLIEADQLQMMGQLTESLKILDSAVDIASKSGDEKSTVDVTLLRASAMTSQAFAQLQNPQATQLEIQRAQASFQDIETLYKKALEIDSTAIEVMAQYAQLKSMIMGDFEEAVNLLARALPLARSSDEVQELCQLLVMNEAQAKTVKVLVVANSQQ